MWTKTVLQRNYLKIKKYSQALSMVWSIREERVEVTHELGSYQRRMINQGRDELGSQRESACIRLHRTTNTGNLWFVSRMKQ